MSENIDIHNPMNILGAIDAVIGTILLIIGSIVLLANYTYINFQNINFQNISNPAFLEVSLAIICLCVGIIHIVLGLKNIVYRPMQKIPNLKADTLIKILKKKDLIQNRKYKLKTITFGIIMSVIFSIFALFLWQSLFTEIFSILILISIVSFVIMTMFLPKLSTADWIHITQDIHSGHPQKLYRILKDGLMELKYENGFEENDKELGQIGIRDTGTTQGYTFAEAYPEIAGSEKSKIATILIIWAGFFIILGFFLIVNNPLALPAPIIGIASVLVGYDFRGKSMKLFNIMRFKSKIILSEIKGEYYKSDLGVGKSLDDSLSSQRIAIITDCRLTHYCANVLSECIKHGDREVVTMSISKDIENDMKFLVRFVEDHRKPDLEVQGIDISRDSMRSANRLLHVNLAMTKAKEKDNKIVSEIDQNKIETKQIQQLEKGVDNDIVFCPQCGTKRNSANFCSKCGRKF